MHTGPGAVDRLFRRPPRAGAPDDLRGFAHGSAGGPAQGVRVDFWLRAADRRVADVRFEAFGGPAAVAAAAWAAEWAVGRGAAEVDALRGLDIAAALELAAEANGVALVVEDALRAALAAATAHAGTR